MTRSLLKNLEELKKTESTMKSFQDKDLKASISSKYDFDLPFDEKKQLEDYLHFLRTWDSESGSREEEIEEIIFHDVTQPRGSKSTLKEEIEEMQNIEEKMKKFEEIDLQNFEKREEKEEIIFHEVTQARGSKSTLKEEIEEMQNIEGKMKKFEEIDLRNFDIYDFEEVKYFPENEDIQKIEDEEIEASLKIEEIVKFQKSEFINTQKKEEIERAFPKKKSLQEFLETEAMTIKLMKEVEEMKQAISSQKKTNETLRNLVHEKEEEYLQRILNSWEDPNFPQVSNFEDNSQEEDIELKEKIEKIDEEEVFKIDAEFEENVSIRQIINSGIEDKFGEEKKKEEYEKMWEEESWMGKMREDEEMGNEIEDEIKNIDIPRREEIEKGEKEEIVKNVDVEEIEEFQNFGEMDQIKFYVMKKLEDIKSAVLEIQKIKKDLQVEELTEDEEMEMKPKFEEIEEIKKEIERLKNEDLSDNFEIEEREEMKKVVKEMKIIVEGGNKLEISEDADVIEEIDDIEEIEEIEEMQNRIEEMKDKIQEMKGRLEGMKEEDKYQTEEIEESEDRMKKSEGKRVWFNLGFEKREPKEEEYLQTLLDVWNEEKNESDGVIIQEVEDFMFGKKKRSEEVEDLVFAIEEIKLSSSKEEIKELISSKEGSQNLNSSIENSIEESETIENISSNSDTINEDSKEVIKDFEEMKNEVMMKNKKVEDILNASMEELARIAEDFKPQSEESVMETLLAIEDKKKKIEDEKNQALEDLRIEFEECQKLMEKEKFDKEMELGIEKEDKMKTKEEMKFLEMPLTKMQIAKNYKERKIWSKIQQGEIKIQEIVQVNEENEENDKSLEDNEIDEEKEIEDYNPIEIFESNLKNSSEESSHPEFSEKFNNQEVNKEAETVENKKSELEEDNKNTTEKTGYDSDDSLFSELRKQEARIFIKGKVYDFDPKKHGVRYFRFLN